MKEIQVHIGRRNQSVEASLDGFLLGEGNGVELNAENIKTALGYTPADQEDVDKLSEEIVDQAEVDDDGIVSFKNSKGLVLFTLDLSDLGGANVYGELVLSTDSITVKEGESATFTVKLASITTGNQPVYFGVSDNTKVSISPASLTFTPENWDVEQTVTVTALEDEDENDEAITISLTSKKVSAKSLLVSIGDNDKPVLTEDGMTLYFNLRNGNLTDSIGGVVATNGGTIVEGGVQLASKDAKFQFVYPVKNENIPNGATIELAMTGLADLKGAGNGYGNGYAYRGAIYTYYTDQGFAYKANGAIVKEDKFDYSNIAFGNIDFTSENHICFVYNADGSKKFYINGEEFATDAIPDGFENYVLSGNITFKIPYSGDGDRQVYPATLSEVRIYERALTDEEVKNNYKVTVSHQNVVNF